MRIGAIVPTLGRLPLEPGLAAIARAAERAGADGLWVDDHVVGVRDAGAPYPYTASGRPEWGAELDRYESLTCCAWLAAATERCRVGTAVLILPQRNVLELAKVAASLDRLSGGRLVLGVGVGWQAAEMEALGYAFATRGRRADEQLDALRACWSGEPAPADGAEVRIAPDLLMLPTPMSGTVPLLVGGMSRPALRRAATRGDGWLAVARLHELDVEQLAAALATLRELRTAAGRAEHPFEAVLKLHARPEAADELPRAAVRLAAAGFDEVAVELDWQESERAVAVLERVKAAVA